MLSRYAQNGASSRYRFYQYLPFLEQDGIHCEVMPLFDEEYLAHRYRVGGVSVILVIRAFVRRLYDLLKARRFDLVLVEKEILPYFPAFPEYFLSRLGVPFIVDFDDALFDQYERHKSFWVRRILGGKIAYVMRKADLVVAGNSYLAAYGHRVGASSVEVLPTVIDLDRYMTSVSVFPREGPFTIGWIGSPSTAKYLASIAPALAQFCKERAARVVLIGSGPVELPGVPAEVVDWNEKDEVQLLQQFDVGIMPLPDEPWARGKCGFKLIQYMACNLPVVASPVGVNCEIVDNGVNGYLAQSTSEWVNALRAIESDVELRQSMGKAGRAKVSDRYVLSATAPRLLKLLQSTARVD